MIAERPLSFPLDSKWFEILSDNCRPSISAQLRM